MHQTKYKLNPQIKKIQLIFPYLWFTADINMMCFGCDACLDHRLSVEAIRSAAVGDDLGLRGHVLERLLVLHIGNDHLDLGQVIACKVGGLFISIGRSVEVMCCILQCLSKGE